MEIFNLLEEEWDAAIILDACRYDSFRSVYKEYLEGGELEKRIGATCTTHWLRSVFEEGAYRDIVYVSGNPWVNSLTAWDGFKPGEKFKEIRDVWEEAWDEQLETVPPSPVTDAAMEARREHPNDRLIIHYLQPHYPYLSNTIPGEIKMYFDGVDGRDRESKNYILSSLSRHVNQSFEKILGRSSFWKLREYFGIKMKSVEEYLWRTYSVQELRDLYEKNLRRVLSEVKKLLDNLEGQLVVTSDHGEAFGEQGDFFHPCGTKNPAVRQIPYWRSTDRGDDRCES